MDYVTVIIVKGDRKVMPMRIIELLSTYSHGG